MFCVRKRKETFRFFSGGFTVKRNEEKCELTEYSEFRNRHLMTHERPINYDLNIEKKNST